MLQTKGLNTINRKQYREQLLNKGTSLIDADTETISEDISLVRPSTKMVWNGTSYETVPANEPAWHVDFETGEKCLLVEGEATNLVVNSNDLSVILAQTGTRLEYENGVTAVYYANNTGTSIPSLSPSIPGDAYFVFSFDFKFNTATAYSSGLVSFGKPTGSGADRWGISFRHDFSVTNYSTTKHPFTLTELNDGWVRCVLYVSPTGGNSSNMKFRGGGVLVDTANSIPFLFVRNVNVVLGTVASSPIITIGTSVARAADTVTYTGTQLTGTELIQMDNDFYCEKDETLPLINALTSVKGGIKQYRHISKNLTDLALNRFGGVVEHTPLHLRIDTSLSNADYVYTISGLNKGMMIDWGDGVTTNITANGTNQTATHDYAVAGEYEIKIWGDVASGGTLQIGHFALTHILDWGTYVLDSVRTWTNDTTRYSPNLTSVPSYLSPTVTRMNNMFSGASAFNQDIGSWDVSNVTNMNNMFRGASAFNQDISQWCVRNIASNPSDFDVNTTAWVKTGRQPVWGTCPRNEDEVD